MLLTLLCFEFLFPVEFRVLVYLVLRSEFPRACCWKVSYESIFIFMDHVACRNEEDITYVGSSCTLQWIGIIVWDRIVRRDGY